MKSITFNKVNVFTNESFTGNPASVCILEQEFLPSEIMQRIAMENGTPETIFIISQQMKHKFFIRYFSSTQEVDMCGHGTIAAAHALYVNKMTEDFPINFQLNNQKCLKVNYKAKKYILELPVIDCLENDPYPILKQGISSHFYKTFIVPGRSWILFYKTENDIKDLQYHPEILKNLKERSIIATAPGVQSDYVLRYFTPKENIKEDYVTGIAQAIIAPLWSKILGKNVLSAHQLSSRPGILTIEVKPNKIEIIGRAFTALSGQFFLS
jgi:phenazine biosynthesis protein PhzF family